MYPVPSLAAGLKEVFTSVSGPPGWRRALMLWPMASDRGGGGGEQGRKNGTDRNQPHWPELLLLSQANASSMTCFHLLGPHWLICFNPCECCHSFLVALVWVLRMSWVLHEPRVSLASLRMVFPVVIPGSSDHSLAMSFGHPHEVGIV